MLAVLCRQGFAFYRLHISDYMAVATGSVSGEVQGRLCRNVKMASRHAERYR